MIRLISSVAAIALSFVGPADAQSLPAPLTTTGSTRVLPNPSFACKKAHSLDEVTICSDAHLAELDRIYAQHFMAARRLTRLDAIRSARRLLRQRAVCGNDRVCILDVLSHAEPGISPPWLRAHRKQLLKDVLKDDLRIGSYNLIGLVASLPISPKGVFATARLIEGVDTDHALVQGEVTQADYVEFCERDPGGERSAANKSVNQCASELLAEEGRPKFSARANCTTKTVTTPNGDPWALVVEGSEIAWKDEAGNVLDASSYTGVAESVFQMLCANTYARIRAQTELPSQKTPD